jgi:hypothetical protein
MSLLPKETILGNLEILEVYEFYDKPCLFSCKNVSGQIFIAIWIDETSYSNAWLYVPTSLRRFQQIVSGGMDLRSSFLNAEDGFVFNVSIPKEDTITEVVRVFCCNLQEDELPTEGEFLTCGSQVIGLLMEKKNVESISIQSRKVALNVAFGFPNMNVMQAPISSLGILLQSIQTLIDALGQFKAGQATVKGNVSEDILRQTQLVIIGAYSGSFGVEMISVSEPDLWGNSLAEDAIEAFLELMKTGKDSQKIRDFLLKAQPRAALRYRVFLEKLVNSKAKISTEWGSFNQGKGGSINLSLADAKIILDIVSEVEEEAPKQYKIVGELVGVNKRTKSFEIWEIKGERKKYSGRIIDKALAVAETATLSENYSATISETIEVSPITGEEKIKYQLVNLKLIK